MKKILLSVCLLMLGFCSVQAQKYFTRDGKISFHSDTPMEKIEAHNSNATSVMDMENGRIEFAVLIKAFQFEKALMQEHFNENYMESTKFPKAIFKGRITNIETINFDTDGMYSANVEGDLTIHGETQKINTEGTFKIVNGQISAHSEFVIAVADYGIKIPKVVRENIAKEVLIRVDLSYEEFNRGS